MCACARRACMPCPGVLDAAAVDTLCARTLPPPPHSVCTACLPACVGPAGLLMYWPIRMYMESKAKSD